jgi:serine/threonine protein kinase
VHPDGDINAYVKWHASLIRLRDKDPASYLARLAALPPDSVPPDLGCTMPREVKAFFSQIVSYTQLASTSLSDCQKTAYLLLAACCDQSTKYYSFLNYIGVGLSGFVFLCTYKKHSPRIVKVVLITKVAQRPLTYDGLTLDPVTASTFTRECHMHALFMARVTDPRIRILRLYSHGIVSSDKARVGVVVMEQGNAPFMSWDMLLDEPKRDTAEAIVRRLIETILSFHRAGLAHNDLHPGNVAVSDVAGPVTVIDFGRSIDLGDLGSSAAALHMRACDLTVPVLNLIDIRDLGPVLSIPNNDTAIRRRIALLSAYMDGARAALTELASDLPPSSRKVVKQIVSLRLDGSPAGVCRAMTTAIEDLLELPLFAKKRAYWDIISGSP